MFEGASRSLKPLKVFGNKSSLLVLLPHSARDSTGDRYFQGIHPLHVLTSCSPWGAVMGWIRVSLERHPVVQIATKSLGPMKHCPGKGQSQQVGKRSPSQVWARHLFVGHMEHMCFFAGQ